MQALLICNVMYEMCVCVCVCAYRCLHVRPHVVSAVEPVLPRVRPRRLRHGAVLLHEVDRLQRVPLANLVVVRVMTCVHVPPNHAAKTQH